METCKIVLDPFLIQIMIELFMVLYDRWDVLTSDLNHIKAVDGHCDLLHGTFDLKYLRWYAPHSLILS